MIAILGFLILQIDVLCRGRREFTFNGLVCVVPTLQFDQRSNANEFALPSQVILKRAIAEVLINGCQRLVFDRR